MQRNTVIIITDEWDVSSQLVSSYLHIMENEFFILTEDSTYSKSIQGKLAKNLFECKGIWLRRGNFPNSHGENTILKGESHTISRYYHFLAERHENCLGSLVKEYDHNKLIDLEIAKSIGLKIPYSVISTTSSSLQALLDKYPSKQFITKGFYDPIRIKINNAQAIFGFTTAIKRSEIRLNIPAKFYPSFIQQKIEKRYEIRVFYMDGKFYNMAIFSQRDKQTELDYRNYNKERPNRNVPYRLPVRIKEKVNKFMEKINLNCGSLDFIYGLDNEYYFLEVNPVGQFGWLSSNCNYYLEQKIANYLSKKKAYA